MSTELLEASQRYSVALEVLSSQDGEHYTRHCATSGLPVPTGSGRRFVVLPGELCSLELTLGENGLTIHKLQLMGLKRAHITAAVRSGANAPDWLPPESTYLIFDGDRTAASAVAERYIPLEGMTAASAPPPAEAVPLDRLAVAVGRSVARANEALSRTQSQGGVALVSSVTIRVAVGRADLAGGRVLLTPLRAVAPDKSGSASPDDCLAALQTNGQFVELTMTTVPCAPSDPAEASGGEDCASRSSFTEQSGGWVRSKG